MAASIRELIINVDMDNQEGLDTISFFRGETLRITFHVLSGGAPVNLSGNNMQLMFKDPNDAQYGTLAFSDEVISSDLPNGIIELEINCDTGQMNTFVNYSSQLEKFMWELTAFVGAIQDRKLAISEGTVTSDVNQCIEGPAAIADQIANTLRWQGGDINGLFTGSTKILDLATLEAYKINKIDFYIKEITNLTGDITISVGTDLLPELILAPTLLASMSQGQIFSFDITGVPAVISSLEAGQATQIIATVTIAGIADSMTIIPILRGSQVSDNDPCG